MIQIQIKKASDSKNPASTLVVFVRKNGKQSEAIGANSEVAHFIGQILDDGLSDADLKKGVFFRNAEVTPHRHLLVLGLDEKFKELEDVRRVAATACQLLKSYKVDSGAVVFDGLVKGFKKIDDVAQAFTEGALLSTYDFDQFKTKKAAKKANGEEKSQQENKLESLQILVGKKLNTAVLQKGVDIGQTLAECVNLARDLGNTPGNLMTPTLLANAALKAAPPRRCERRL